MKTIFAVILEYNVKDDSGWEIVSLNENHHDACVALAEQVKEDYQYLDWMSNQCEYVESRYEDGESIPYGAEFPEAMSYFNTQVAKDNPGEYSETMYIREYTLTPSSK